VKGADILSAIRGTTLARVSLEIYMLDLRRTALHAALLLLAAAAPARALCPNGILEPPEQCDDGNDIPGDGCSPLCLLEVVNHPPVCGAAVATPDSLWPPNHKFVPVTVDGVVDPDGDPVLITITGVAQDEPVEAEGDGNTCVDATGIGTDVAALRSERSGGGDGRVYHVAFRADDPHGGACLGEVDVCVRHDNGHGGACGDEGPLFDSTVGVCGAPGGDDCDLDECVPPPPFVVASCDVPLPPFIERRLLRTRHLLEVASGARAGRRTRLARIAERRLARIDAVVERRLGGECGIEVHDMIEAAGACAACPFVPGEDGHHGGDDDQGHDDHGHDD
jgi:cysteine-rich repeat protein